MAEEENANVSLPPGKLQNLKKMFEEKNAQSSDTAAKVMAGRGIQVLPATPPKPIPGATTNHPKPAPRQFSPAMRDMTTSEIHSGSSNSMNNVFGSEGNPMNYCTVPRPRKRTTSASKDQEWSSTLDRKSAAQKKLSPTISRRVAMFSEEDGSKGEKAGDEDDNSGVERRFLSPAARSGNPKRLSDPCTDMDSPGACRRNSAERRRTMDNFALPDDDVKPAEVKVQDQIRKFQEKPSLPKKPVIVNAAPPVLPSGGSPPKPVTKLHEHVDASYEDPWDLKPGKNVERLKAMSGDQQSPQKVKPPTQDVPSAARKDKVTASKPIPDKGGTGKPTPDKGTAGKSPPDKANTGKSPPDKANTGKSTPHRTKPSASRQISRPTEQPPPPPSKPPRTFVHSDYLEGKAQGDSSQSPSAQNVTLKQSTERDVMSVSSTQGSNGGEQEVTMRGGGKSAHPPSTEEPREMKGIREKPPSRPPPPRPRPISEASTLNRRHAARHKKEVANPGDNDEGPVVISLKTGRPISRQVSMSNAHRQPNDQLPDKPEQDGSLRRFPLRKSYSSECLFQGSVSSLSEPEPEPEKPVLQPMLQSYHPRDAEEPIYEAIIDSEGYAVPNQFMRCLPNENNHVARGGQDSPTKAGFLKRFLAPSSGGTPPSSLPTTTPIKDQDVEKVSAKKMNLVRQKINQAYEALQVVFRGSSVSEEGDLDTGDHPSLSEDRDSNFISYISQASDSDSIVDVKEIKRRVTYCSTVRLKSLQSVKKAREFMDRIYPQLFEYALIVGLSAKTDDPGYEPVILHKFPQTVESNMSVPKFCFPDAEEFRPGSISSTSESYSFVLTHMDGNRMYGYCRRMQPRDASLPEVICIISPIDAFNMYNKLLSEIESRRYKSLDHAQEMIAASFGRPMPKPGKVCHIRALDEKCDMETVFLERPSDPHLENVNYESLLLYLGTDKLIKVFASMLMERRLILCSKQLSALTQTIHALVALLYPFHWQHSYIPLLPPEMVGVCSSPTPFIIGVLRAHLPLVTVQELEDVIIVDLDSRQVIREMGDELSLLPKKVQKALKTAVNMCKIDSEAQHSQWLMVSEAFLRMFLETVGHFTQHVFTQQDGSKTLMKDQFIAGAPSKAIRQFLEWFTETQMFDVFISMQLEKQHWGTMDLFMARLAELQKKRQADSCPSNSKGIGQKVKNLGKALKTKLKD